MTDENKSLSEAALKALAFERDRPASPAEVERLAARLQSQFSQSPPHVEAPTPTANGPSLSKSFIFLGGLALGAVGGAFVQQRLNPPKEVIVERVVIRDAVPVAPVVQIERPAQPEDSGVRIQRRERKTSPMNVERLLVEQAAAALARAQADEALKACDQHAAQFPTGHLIEERESVAIRALVLLGRQSEALTRAKAFREQFPESLLLDVVDAAIGPNQLE